jgi:hypothetical protein
VGALPPHPRSLALTGNQEGQKKRAEPKALPLRHPRRGARVALQQSPILRAHENTILYLKKLDTEQKLRHEKEHLTHHHHWKKQVLLRITALYLASGISKERF